MNTIYINSINTIFFRYCVLINTSFQILCSYCVKCCNYSFDMINCLQNSLRNFYLLLRCFSISVSLTTIISQYKNVLYKQTYFQGHTVGRVWFIILTCPCFCLYKQRTKIPLLISRYTTDLLTARTYYFRSVFLAVLIQRK